MGHQASHTDEIAHITVLLDATAFDVAAVTCGAQMEMPRQARSQQQIC